MIDVDPRSLAGGRSRGSIGVLVTTGREQLASVRVVPGDIELPAGDYAAPGALMIVRSPLHREPPDTWYGDRRLPLAGLLNRGEIILRSFGSCWGTSSGIR